jgi:hypothetical protein
VKVGNCQDLNTKKPISHNEMGFFLPEIIYTGKEKYSIKQV